MPWRPTLLSSTKDDHSPVGDSGASRPPNVIIPEASNRCSIGATLRAVSGRTSQMLSCHAPSCAYVAALPLAAAALPVAAAARCSRRPRASTVEEGAEAQIGSVATAVPSVGRVTQLCSVVVTTHNQCPYIGAALDSVFAQTVQPLEVIVVDDGSTDGTRDMLDAYGDRIALVLQDNRGVAAARNAGVARATGKLVAFLDGDDVWSPGKLELQTDVATAFPSAGLIAVEGYEFDETGVIGSTLFGPAALTLLNSRSVVVGHYYRDLVHQNFIATMSQTMVRREVLERTGPSNTNLHVASDYDLYLRIAAEDDVCLVRESLVGWRYVASSASGPRERREFRWGEEALLVLERHAAEGPTVDRPFVLQELRWRLFRTAQRAYFYGREHDRRWARRYLFRLARRYPGSRHVLGYWLALSLPPPLVHAIRRGVGGTFNEPDRSAKT
jgi:glycosyltransferase involved in cell wall biosynthesis